MSLQAAARAQEESTSAASPPALTSGGQNGKPVKPLPKKQPSGSPNQGEPILPRASKPSKALCLAATAISSASLALPDNQQDLGWPATCGAAMALQPEAGLLADSTRPLSPISGKLAISGQHPAALPTLPPEAALQGPQ